MIEQQGLKYSGLHNTLVALRRRIPELDRPGDVYAPSTWLVSGHAVRPVACGAVQLAVSHGDSGSAVGVVGCSLWWLTLSAACLHEGAQLDQAQRCRRQADAAPWPPVVASGEEAACSFHPEVCVPGLPNGVPESRGVRLACPA